MNVTTYQSLTFLCGDFERLKCHGKRCMAKGIVILVDSSCTIEVMLTRERDRERNRTE